MANKKKKKKEHTFLSGDLRPQHHYVDLINGIKAWLVNSTVSKSKSLVSITGSVRGENFNARVTIGIEPTLRTSPPNVFCHRHVDWVYRTPAWHCDSAGNLCWVLHKEWVEIQNWMGKKSGDVVTDTLTWLKISVTNLLERHWVGRKYSLPEDKWPDEWKDWRHYSEGVRQYFSEKQKKCDKDADRTD